jgi:gamma-glutamyltranspeptidase/glutathione hydrolase
MRRTLSHALLALTCAAAADAASGRRGMVAAEHRLAAEAGIRILQLGGNAVDAAIATALAACVVNPSSCGIGGGGFMLVFDRRSGRVHALDYRERAPAAATAAMFVRDGEADAELSRFGGLAVAVPGEVAGLLAAHRRFGRLPFGVAAAPAIAHARDGFAVEAHLAQVIERNQERIRRQPELAGILLRPDGSPREVGDRLQQPALARTLERIVAEGAKAFYEGPVAEAITGTVQASGGVLTRDDLSAYRPVWRAPLHGRFHGADVYSMPPPSSGGGLLIQTLNILAGDDLRHLGHQTPTYLHLLAEAMQFGFAARATGYGDPDFVAVPLARLLSPAGARKLRRRISAVTTFSPAYYGDGEAGDDAGTSHLSVADGDGNAVACTTSVNTAFGSMLVAGDTGIILNNTMDDFSVRPGVPNVYGLIGSAANAIAPHKRPLSSMTPTIVARDGAVELVAGGSGGPFIISATLQTLLNSMVFDMDAAAAVAAARLHHQWMPPVVMLEPALAGVATALQRRGHRTMEAAGIGAVQLIRWTADGLLDGAADPRKGGEAVGW